MSTNSDTSSDSTPPSPWQPLPLLEIRTGKIKSVFGPGMKSAIHKSPITGSIELNPLGCIGDEHQYSGHGGPDKALLWFNAEHYDSWKQEMPEQSDAFVVGAYGENLVTRSVGEQDVCIGDVVGIGSEVVIAVAEPRQPCYMLNHRFKIKDMARRSQDTGRTGWYCRVLKAGRIQAGDEIRLMARPNPRWSVARVQHFLYRDMRNDGAMRELCVLPELGKEIRELFANRLRKRMEDQQERLESYDEAFKEPWADYSVSKRSYETPRILSVTFDRISREANPQPVLPGSHVRLKLGGDLVRAYSVVEGDENRFELGIALSDDSRGGSKYIHESLKLGDTLLVSNITTSFPLHADADQHIFLAGGIGLTAFIAAAKYCHEKQIPFHLHYLVRNDADIAFSKHINLFAENTTIHDTSSGTRCDIDAIMKKANSLTHVYCCGSENLMDDVKRSAAQSGVAGENLHFEAFTTKTSGDPFTATLSKSDRVLKIAGRQTLLDVLRDAGLEVSSSCEVGNCGTCQVGVKAGRVEHRGTGLMSWEKDDRMLSCVSRGIGNIVIEL